jgi:hypothetical protein
MSKNYKKLIENAKAELLIAKDAGVREQTLNAIKDRIKHLRREFKQEKRNKNIKHFGSWPDEILMQRYDEVTKFTTEREKDIRGIGLFNSEDREEDMKKFEDSLRLVEILEDEGRRRKMLYFMTDKERATVIKDIFGVEPKKMTDEEKKLHEQAERKGATVYTIEAGRVSVLA